MRKPAVVIEADFEAGRQARRDNIAPVENPYLASHGAHDRFNSWSDGWLEEDLTRIGRRRPTVLQKEAIAYQRRHGGSTRGITARW